VPHVPEAAWKQAETVAHLMAAGTETSCSFGCEQVGKEEEEPRDKRRQARA